MNNLHRELAPISEAAWADLEQEARRTFKRWIAGRRVVDVSGPAGPELAAVGNGRLTELSNTDGVRTRLRETQSLVELRVPFEVSRAEVDGVERGSQDADWQPVKDAVRKLALAEDDAIFNGATEAGITGIVPSSSNKKLKVPSEVRDLPDVVAKALSELRLAGVDGPYTLLLSAENYTAVSEITDHGYPIREHINRLLDGEVIWAPAVEGALLLSTRGGDYELFLGQDVSIGYLSHDSETVQLYFQESLTFVAYTSEASVAIAG